MKDKVTMVVFVLVLGTILTTALLWVDSFTAPLIAKNQTIKIKLSVLKALGINATKETLDTVFSENVTSRTTQGQELYYSRTGKVAFLINGPGLWGPISGVLSLAPDLKTIQGITIIHQEETPGLGSRIAEAEYLTAFKEKVLAPSLALVPPGRATGIAQIDGITGATMSCQAFVDLINSEYASFLPLLQGK